MGLLQNFRRQTLNLIAPAIGVCTVFYFGYHVLNGERGFLVWWDLRHRIQRAQSVADSTELKKRVLETRVRLLDPRSLDPDMLEDLWIPVIVIGTSGTAGMIRRLRANLLDELQKQYVVTGRAKGLPPRRLLWKYPLRVALNPFIADIGSILPDVVSGSAIVASR